MEGRRRRVLSGVGFLGTVVLVGLVQIALFPVATTKVAAETLSKAIYFLTVAAGLVVVPFSQTLSTVESEAAEAVYPPILVGLGLLGVQAVTDLLGQFLVHPGVFASVFEQMAAIIGMGSILLGLVRWNRHYERQQRLLEERSDRLEEQNDRLEQFASVVSHDLRNPLEIAQGRLKYARETGEAVHFEEIADALDRIDRIVTDVLALSRTGESALEETTVGLGTLAEDAWATVDTDDATLAVESDRTLRADESLSRQLLENLFRNAVEHGTSAETDGGSPRGLAVRVGSLPDGFYVEDTGPGVPEDEREQVFETGYTTSSSGTGLGLDIVGQIAEAHGWSVRLGESEDGGARFEFCGVADPDRR